MARRARQGPIGAAKKSNFEHNEKAFLLTSAGAGRLNFTLPKTGAGFVRVRGDLPLEAAFFFEIASAGVELDGPG